MANSVSRFLGNVRVFSERLGGINGVFVYLKMTLHKLLPGLGGVPVPLSVPQSRAPVYYRPKTTDAHAFRQVFCKGDYDFLVPFEPRVIVDAGAHVGYASLYLLHRFPGAKVFAIEPEPSNADMYARNLEHSEGVRLFRGAIWGENTRLDISNPGADTWSFRMAEVEGDDEGGVEAITVPEIMEEMGDIDILKLDIEGGEYSLFKADTGWLDRVNMVVLELHERYAPGVTQLTDDILTAAGFTKAEEKGENVIYVKE